MPFAGLRSAFKKVSPLVSGLVGALIVGVVATIVSLSFNFSESFSGSTAESELRVLAYSSFTSSWGPGPTLAKMFEEKTGVKVILLQADDAGLLLAKMASFPSDVVIGFDQLSRPLAKRTVAWKKHQVAAPRFQDSEFLAFDWSPIGFLYREGEIEPPKDFQDLLSPRFEGSIALQDPRSSSPGLQFLNWLALEMGEDASFEYLARLKPNVHSMSGSWSQAYGLFTRGLAKMSFGYATSVLYHQQSENDHRYKFIFFPVRHPVQVEFAAIPAACRQCEHAREFMKFLVSVEAQTVIMNRNWMLPVNADAAEGTPFEELTKTPSLSDEVSSTTAPDSTSGNGSGAPSVDPMKLLKRWSEVGL